MDRTQIGLAGFAIVLVLLALRVPVAIALGVTAFVGTGLIVGIDGAWGVLTTVPYSFTSKWDLSAVPMFLMMGYVASQAGLTSGLFTEFRKLFHRVPGGLAATTGRAAARRWSGAGLALNGPDPDGRHDVG